MMKKNFVKLFSFGAGITDSLTGLGLFLAPEITLKLMGVDCSLYQLELIRFVGAFVFAVGSLYLWGLYFGGTTLRVLWWATAWARLCVGVVTGSMILRGLLGGEWIAVPLTDLGVAVFQGVWLLRFTKEDDF